VDQILVKELNAISVSSLDLLRATQEVQKLPKDKRGWESRMLTISALFPDVPRKAMAVEYRLVAMTQILQLKVLPEWTQTKAADGTVSLSQAVWQVAASAPLQFKDQQESFEVGNFVAQVQSFAPSTQTSGNAIKIIVDDLQGPQIHALLQEHLKSMHLHSPPESVHALDIEALRHPDIVFWTAWNGSDLLGCVALKRLSLFHAELKSMRTAHDHLRKGVAKALLKHCLSQARQLGVKKISLETGSMAAFEPARSLYSSMGFVYCGPFEGYTADPFSVFMEQQL
jgi:putative acetyltransferase